MHICFITSEYPKKGYPHGGVGTFVKTIADSLTKKGIIVSVVGLNYNSQSEESCEEGVRIYRLSNKRIRGITWLVNSIKISKKIQDIHNKEKIDIIESAELGLAFIRKIHNVNYVVRLHGGHHFFSEAENRGINWWKGFQEKRSLNKADRVIGVSEYVLNHTSKYIGFNNKLGPVIYNPANLEKFYEIDSTKKVQNRIFFAGTLCEKKGIRQLIDALPIVKEEFRDAHLVIAGRDSKIHNGHSYREFLNSLIVPDVRDAVTFLGAIPNDDIPKEIEKSEVCVYPSHMEAMPLAWIEVMSMGASFIGSSTGPGPEVVTNGVTGLLCNPLSPKDIAEKIKFILKDRELAESMGQNARIDMQNRFALHEITLQNIAFYESLL